MFVCPLHMCAAAAAAATADDGGGVLLCLCVRCCYSTQKGKQKLVSLYTKECLHKLNTSIACTEMYLCVCS